MANFALVDSLSKDPNLKRTHELTLRPYHNNH